MPSGLTIRLHDQFGTGLFLRREHFVPRVLVSLSINSTACYKFRLNADKFFGHGEKFSQSGALDTAEDLTGEGKKIVRG